MNCKLILLSFSFLIFLSFVIYIRQEGKSYRVIQVGVSLQGSCDNANEEEEMMMCRTYQMVDFVHTQPSPQYKGVIVAGALKARLPSDYMNRLNAIEDNGYDGPSILDEIGVNNL